MLQYISPQQKTMTTKRIDYHSATYFCFHLDRRFTHSKVSWVISREQVVPQRIIRDILHCRFLPRSAVAQINQKSLDSLNQCQTSQISRKLLFSCVLFFTVLKHCYVSSVLVPSSTDYKDGCEYRTSWRLLSFSDKKWILVLNTPAKYFHME